MDSEAGSSGVQPALRSDRILTTTASDNDHAHALPPAPLPPRSPPTRTAPPPPLPATGTGFKCPSPHCREKLPYGNAAGYIQHLNSRHHGEGPYSLRISGRLPDITTCRDCSQFCLNAKGLAAHRKRTHKESAVPGPAGQLAPTATSPPPAPDPAPPNILEANQDLLDEELLDLFQRSLYDVHRAWRAPLLRIVRRLSQGILEGSPAAEEKCTLAFLLLPSLVAECHFGKWISVGDLLAHLGRGIDLTRSDEDYGGMVLAQAHAVVPRVQAYRARAADRRNTTPALDHSAVASLQRQIDASSVSDACG